MLRCSFWFAVTYSRRRIGSDTDHVHISVTHCRFTTLRVHCLSPSPAAEGLNLNPPATFTVGPAVTRMSADAMCLWPRFLLRDLHTHTLPSLLSSDYSVQIFNIMRYIYFLILRVLYSKHFCFFFFFFFFFYFFFFFFFFFFFRLNYSQISLQGEVSC